MLLCCPCFAPRKLKLLWHKGMEKVREDFDLVKMARHMSDQRVMFNYYRGKHSDLMIKVNANKATIVNIAEDLSWKDAEPEPVVLTKFDTYRGSSEEEEERTSKMDEDDDDIDMNAISSESSVRKSASKQSESSVRPPKPQIQSEENEDQDEDESDYYSDKDDEDDDSDTARTESRGTSGRPDVVTDNALNADFDDISENPLENRQGAKHSAIKENRAKPVSFDAVKHENK